MKTTFYAAFAAISLLTASAFAADPVTPTPATPVTNTPVTQAAPAATPAKATTGKPNKCVKGKPCGKGCIPKDRECKIKS